MKKFNNEDLKKMIIAGKNLETIIKKSGLTQNTIKRRHGELMFEADEEEMKSLIEFGRTEKLYEKKSSKEPVTTKLENKSLVLSEELLKSISCDFEKDAVLKVTYGKKSGRLTVIRL